MCTVCGLPSTHSNLVQTASLFSLYFFTLTTVLGAWWIVSSARVRRFVTKIKSRFH